MQLTEAGYKTGLEILLATRKRRTTGVKAYKYIEYHIVCIHRKLLMEENDENKEIQERIARQQEL